MSYQSRALWESVLNGIDERFTDEAAELLSRTDGESFDNLYPNDPTTANSAGKGRRSPIKTVLFSAAAVAAAVLLFLGIGRLAGIKDDGLPPLDGEETYESYDISSDETELPTSAEDYSLDFDMYERYFCGTWVNEKGAEYSFGWRCKLPINEKEYSIGLNKAEDGCYLAAIKKADKMVTEVWFVPDSSPNTAFRYRHTGYDDGAKKRNQPSETLRCTARDEERGSVLNTMGILRTCIENGMTADMILNGFSFTYNGSEYQTLIGMSDYTHLTTLFGIVIHEISGERITLSTGVYNSDTRATEILCLTLSKGENGWAVSKVSEYSPESDSEPIPEISGAADYSVIEAVFAGEWHCIYGSDTITTIQYNRTSISKDISDPVMSAPRRELSSAETDEGWYLSCLRYEQKAVLFVPKADPNIMYLYREGVTDKTDYFECYKRYCYAPGETLELTGQLTELGSEALLDELGCTRGELLPEFSMNGCTWRAARTQNICVNVMTKKRVEIVAWYETDVKGIDEYDSAFVLLFEKGEKGWQLVSRGHDPAQDTALNFRDFGDAGQDVSVLKEFYGTWCVSSEDESETQYLVLNSSITESFDSDYYINPWISTLDVDIGVYSMPDGYYLKRQDYCYYIMRTEPDKLYVLQPSQLVGSYRYSITPDSFYRVFGSGDNAEVTENTVVSPLGMLELCERYGKGFAAVYGGVKTIYEDSEHPNSSETRLTKLTALYAEELSDNRASFLAQYATAGDYDGRETLRRLEFTNNGGWSVEVSEPLYRDMTARFEYLPEAGADMTVFEQHFAGDWLCSVAADMIETETISYKKIPYSLWDAAGYDLLVYEGSEGWYLVSDFRVLMIPRDNPDIMFDYSRGEPENLRLGEWYDCSFRCGSADAEISGELNIFGMNKLYDMYGDFEDTVNDWRTYIDPNGNTWYHAQNTYNEDEIPVLIEYGEDKVVLSRLFSCSAYDSESNRKYSTVTYIKQADGKWVAAVDGGFGIYTEGDELNTEMQCSNYYNLFFGIWDNGSLQLTYDYDTLERQGQWLIGFRNLATQYYMYREDAEGNLYVYMMDRTDKNKLFTWSTKDDVVKVLDRMPKTDLTADGFTEPESGWITHSYLECSGVFSEYIVSSLKGTPIKAADGEYTFTDRELSEGIYLESKSGTEYVFVVSAVSADGSKVRLRLSLDRNDERVQLREAAVVPESELPAMPEYSYYVRRTQYDNDAVCVLRTDENGSRCAVSYGTSTTYYTNSMVCADDVINIEADGKTTVCGRLFVAGQYDPAVQDIGVMNNMFVDLYTTSEKHVRLEYAGKPTMFTRCGDYLVVGKENGEYALIDPMYYTTGTVCAVVTDLEINGDTYSFTLDGRRCTQRMDSTDGDIGAAMPLLNARAFAIRAMQTGTDLELSQYTDKAESFKRADTEFYRVLHPLIPTYSEFTDLVYSVYDNVYTAGPVLDYFAPLNNYLYTLHSEFLGDAGYPQSYYYTYTYEITGETDTAADIVWTLARHEQIGTDDGFDYSDIPNVGNFTLHAVKDSAGKWTFTEVMTDMGVIYGEAG